MKDIDFDELDKAVNSLMASTNAAETPSPTSTSVPTHPAVDPVPAASTTPAVETPTPASAPVPIDPTPTVVPSLSPVAPEGQTAVPSQPAAPVIRRTGRFMDMVSSKPADVKPRASVPASREGLSITPRPEPQLSTVSAAVQGPVDAPVTAPSPAVAPTTMPDPIDMMNAADTSVAPVVDETPSSDVVEQITAPVPGSNESPFLTDAKVEKRPLNAGTSVTQEVTDEPLVNLLDDRTDEPTDAESDSDRSADEPPTPPQVPELDNQLVAIESSDQLSEESQPDVAAASNDTTAAAPAPLGATSIAQQYTTQPSSGDQSHAAIYDASQYPEPLKHPAKSKSGWLWVLWVILLLGVGAGGAVALYAFDIIP